MIYFNVLLFISTVYAANNNCQLSQSNFAANWTMTNKGLDIQVTYNNLEPNREVDIDFGYTTDYYAEVTFANQDGQVMVTTGLANGTGTDYIDPSNQATVHYATLNGNALNALVTLPLKFNGIDMTACHSWWFYDLDSNDDNDSEKPVTSITVNVPNVCPSKCT